jgi:hypothetical protein
MELPKSGIIELVDAETGAFFMVDTSSDKVRRTYSEKSARKIEERARMFGSIGVDHIDIRTDKPYLDELIKFFRMRRRRI